MPRPYSMDLRERVIESIAAGALRRETAEQFGLRSVVPRSHAARRSSSPTVHLRNRMVRIVTSCRRDLQPDTPLR
jgi:hypothetical protein